MLKDALEKLLGGDTARTHVRGISLSLQHVIDHFDGTLTPKEVLEANMVYMANVSSNPDIKRFVKAGEIANSMGFGPFSEQPELNANYEVLLTLPSQFANTLALMDKYGLIDMKRGVKNWSLVQAYLLEQAAASGNDVGHQLG